MGQLNISPAGSRALQRDRLSSARSLVGKIETCGHRRAKRNRLCAGQRTQLVKAEFIIGRFEISRRSSCTFSRELDGDRIDGDVDRSLDPIRDGDGDRFSLIKGLNPGSGSELSGLYPAPRWMYGLPRENPGYSSCWSPWQTLDPSQW